MKTRYLCVATSIVALAFTTCFLVSVDKDSNDGAKQDGTPVSHPRGRGNRDPQTRASQAVALNGTLQMEAMITRKVPLADIGKSLMPFEASFPALPVDRLARLENLKITIQCDTDGNLASVRINPELYQTVSRRGEIVEMFSKKGIRISSIGNAIARVDNDKFIHDLIHLILEFGDPEVAEYVEGKGWRFKQISEIGIIPISYVETTSQTGAGSAPRERMGLLWMAKHDSITGELAATWPQYTQNNPFPIEEAQWLEWYVIPISDSISDNNIFAGRYDWIGTPEPTFERRLMDSDITPGFQAPPYPWGSTGVGRDQ